MRSLVVVLLLTLAAAGVAAQEPEPQAEETTLWEDVVALYDRAKAAGERVPKDVYDWAKQDVHKIGDWQYRVADLEASDAAEVETWLNELGAERWECLWVESHGDKTRYILKRPARSYLKTLPLSDVLKLIQMGSADEGSAP